MDVHCIALFIDTEHRVFILVWLVGFGFVVIVVICM